MDEKKPEVQTQPAQKPKSGSKSKPKAEEPGYLIDWKSAAEEIEAELKERKWNSAMQKRNPRFLMGLVQRHIVRLLVQAIHKRG